MRLSLFSNPSVLPCCMVAGAGNPSVVHWHGCFKALIFNKDHRLEGLSGVRVFRLRICDAGPEQWVKPKLTVIHCEKITRPKAQSLYLRDLWIVSYNCSIIIYNLICVAYSKEKSS